jgi:hypothetical protein
MIAPLVWLSHKLAYIASLFFKKVIFAFVWLVYWRGG